MPATPAHDNADPALAEYQAEKAALLEAMAGTGILTVTVNYEGEGGMGHVEDIDVEAEGDRTVSLKRRRITMPGESERKSLHDALADFTDNVVHTLHYGWQKEDGGYGTMTFDVANKEVMLDHNAREVTVHNDITEI